MPVAGSAPWLSSLGLMSASPTMRVISPFSFITMSRGVLAGARKAYQAPMSMSLYPASMKVGTCGNKGERLLPEIAMGLTLPAWMKP